MAQAPQAQQRDAQLFFRQARMHADKFLRAFARVEESALARRHGEQIAQRLTKERVIAHIPEQAALQ